MKPVVCLLALLALGVLVGTGLADSPRSRSTSGLSVRQVSMINVGLQKTYNPSKSVLGAITPAGGGVAQSQNMKIVVLPVVIVQDNPTSRTGWMTY